MSNVPLKNRAEHKHRMIHPVGFRANRVISEFTGFHPVPDKLQNDFSVESAILYFLKLFNLTTKQILTSNIGRFSFFDVALRAASILKNSV